MLKGQQPFTQENLGEPVPEETHQFWIFNTFPLLLLTV